MVRGTRREAHPGRPRLLLQRARARLRRAWVATQASTELRLSDHAPLVVEFEVESVAMENLSP